MQNSHSSFAISSKLCISRHLQPFFARFFALYLILHRLNLCARRATRATSPLPSEQRGAAVARHSRNRYRSQTLRAVRLGRHHVIPALHMLRGRRSNLVVSAVGMLRRPRPRAPASEGAAAAGSWHSVGWPYCLFLRRFPVRCPYSNCVLREIVLSEEPSVD